MTAARPVLVLHDAGDPAAGPPWADALESAGWPGEVHAPDLPGHGWASPPVDGACELVDAAFAVLPVLGRLAVAPVVVGVGANGWAAQLLAHAGRASALVLVDGLGGPWLSPAESIARERDWLRAVFDDPAALRPVPAGEVDPRFRHIVHRQTSLDLARRGAAALHLPVLVLESPATSAGRHRAELVARIDQVAVADVEAPDAETVAPHLVAWGGQLPGHQDVGREGV